MGMLKVPPNPIKSQPWGPGHVTFESKLAAGLIKSRLREITLACPVEPLDHHRREAEGELGTEEEGLRCPRQRLRVVATSPGTPGPGSCKRREGPPLELPEGVG